MNRKSLVRGIQIIVLLTLASFTWVLVNQLRTNRTSLADGFAQIKPLWLLLASVLALQEGVCGGLRIWVLARVLTPKIKVKTAIISEFVLMFAAGATPGQAGAAAAQLAVLMNAGMKFSEVGAAEMCVMFCTIFFFVFCAVTIVILQKLHWLAAMGGANLQWLLITSSIGFGITMAAMILCTAYPPLLKAVVRGFAKVFGPIWRLFIGSMAKTKRFAAWGERHIARRGSWTKSSVHFVDELHAGMVIYVRRGKLALLAALMLTFAFFTSRFAVAYFILLGLGIPTTPETFVAIGPPIVQVILVQALLNFALYLSPTPGASGVAEAASLQLMRPWVKGVFELPYLAIWRILALFLCMFVGGIFMFRYLGTDVLEAKIKEQKGAREEDDEATAEKKDEKPDPTPT